MSDEYDLAKSSKKLGPLVPILKDKNGNIIDGFHRQNANPDWPTITVESVDSDAKLELARLATNFCRRRLEPSEIQNRLSFLVGKCGMKPEEIAEQTGIGLTTIYKYLPQELKDEKKVEAGKASGEARSVPSAEHTVKTHDMVICEFCHIASSDIQTEVVNSKPRKLCVRCQGNFVLAPERFTAFFRNVNGEVKTLEERLQPKPEPLYKEKWEHKVGTMRTNDPEAERLHDEEAQALGLHGFRVHPEIPVIVIKPDRFHVETNTLFWYDNEELHEGERADKDEKYREIMEKRGFKNEVLTYKGKTTRAKVRAFLEAWQKKTGA